MKPCPNCGSTDLFSDNKAKWHIRCLECGLSGPGGLLASYAVAAWEKLPRKDVGTKENAFDGNWNASTMGEFLSLLVDGGDVAVLWRVKKNRVLSSDYFTRTYEVQVVPDGHVRGEIIALQDRVRLHRVLDAMLKADVVR